MKNVLRMVWLNVVLAYRIRIAFFFTVIFPLGFFFIYAALFGHGNANVLTALMGPLISLSVISSSMFGLSVQLVVMRERDMLRRYHLAPIHAWQMIVSRLLSNYLLFLPMVILQFALAIKMYHMPVPSHLFGLWLIYTLAYIAMGGMGLVVAGVVNTMQEAQVLNQILFFGLIFLSGSTVPLSSLPHVIQKLALFMPPTLMIVSTTGMMTAGQTTWQHLPEILGLIFISISSLGLAVTLFRWEKEAKATRRSRIQALIALLPVLLVGIYLNTSSSFTRTNAAVMRAMEMHFGGGSSNAAPDSAPQKIDPRQIPKP